jgi:hypothetical protein
MMRLLLALLLLPGLAETGVAQTAPPSPTMLDAARTFPADLNPAQKSKAVLPFNSEERFRWFYTPVSRKGIPLKELSASQKLAALALLRAGLSESGYTKAEMIRKLEKCYVNWSRAVCAIQICTSLPSSESRPRMAVLVSRCGGRMVVQKCSPAILENNPDL